MVQYVKPAAEIRVLHVDDDRSFLDVSKIILSDVGNFQIELAFSVDDALSKLNCNLFDVIVSDYDMPTTNGLDFLKLIREKFPSIPFILFTGKGREEIAVQALNLGADRYLSKQGDPQIVYTELSVSIFQLYEKSQAQKLLWESEERFKKMVTNSKDMIMLTRNDGVILYVSPACKKILGYESEELVGKNPWIIHPEDTERIQKIYQSVLKNPASDTTEYRILTKQGETRWLSHSYSQIIENGEIKQIVSTVKDITEIKNAEEKLRESEEKFSVAFRSDGAALTISRLTDGLFIDVNDCFLKMFGYNREEVIGKTSLQIHLYANPEERQEIINQVIYNQPVINREVKALKKDYTEIIVLFSTKIVNIKGQSHLLTTFIDITNLKQTEKELFMHQKEIENFITMAPDSVTIINPEGKIIECNEITFKNMGYTKKEDLIGHSILEFIVEHDHKKILHAFESILKGQSIKKLSFDCKRRNGEIISMEGSSKAILDESGIATALVTIIRDITDNIKKEKKITELLEQSERRASNLKELLAISQLVLKNNEPQTILKHILSAYKKIVACKSGIIILTKKEKETKAALFYNHGKIITIPNNIPELLELCQEICSEKNPILINDLNQSKIANRMKNMPYTIPQNAAFIPLKNKHEVIGYIILADKKEGFDENELLIGSLLAEFAQIALENNAIVQAITNSEMQMRAITDSAKDAIIMLDSEGKVSFWSQTAAKMFGYTIDEIRGQNFHKMFASETCLEKFEKGFEEFKKTGTSILIGNTIELTGKKKSGQEFPIELSLSLIRISKKPNAVGLIRDISERKIVEQKLKDSEERYHFVAENANDLITVSDKNSILQYVSPSVKHILGLNPEDVIGKNGVLKVLCPDEMLKLNPKMQKLLQTGELPPLEFHLTNKAGKTVWLEANISRVNDESGEIHFISIARDVTQRKIAQEERDKALAKTELLLEKLSVVGRFTRHDIRNKLTLINSLLYLTNKQANNNEILKKHLQEISTSTKNINRILEFAETYEVAGSQGLFWIQMKKSIDDVKDLFIDVKKLKIIVTDMDFEVLADSALIEVFHNLIENSLKYGSPLTEIRIFSQKKENENLKIIYEDNGGGIASEIKPHLFQKGAGKGTGLGLYLIQRICEIYGWKIQENGVCGKSARFEIDIPQKLWRPLKSERNVNMQIIEYKSQIASQKALKKEKQ